MWNKLYWLKWVILYKNYGTIWGYRHFRCHSLCFTAKSPEEEEINHNPNSNGAIVYGSTYLMFTSREPNHDGGIEMWGGPVGEEKLYLSIWSAIMSSTLQSISWIPATNNFCKEGSREPYHKLKGSFFPLVADRTALWHATGDSRKKKKIITWHVTSFSLSLFFVNVCVCGGREGGPTYVWHVLGRKAVNTMCVRIVVTCFKLLKTRCKLYQSPNKSCWKKNTTQDIWLFNDCELRWRWVDWTEPEWGCVGSAREWGV